MLTLLPGEAQDGGYIDVTVVDLAIHCGPIAGGYGCDLGELPAPPVELAFVLYAIAAAGLAIGTYSVISGRFLIKYGQLKQIWSKSAARLIGVSLVIWSLFAILLGWETAILSRHVLPSPGWVGLLGLPVVIVTLSLDWWAYSIDRRHTPPTLANGRDA